MTDLRQAAQMALDAWDDPAGMKDLCVAMDALRTALEQQQAEPPSEWPLIKNILDEYGLQAISFVAEWKAAQQQTEPMAWMDREGDLYKMPEIKNWAPPHTILYTTPPQRQWVGLTDEEIKEIIGPWGDTAVRGYTRKLFDRIEAKLKEKNSD